MTKSMAVIYTDGGCSPNPGPGAWAYILQVGDDIREGSGGELQTTNNRMEMLAAIHGLEAAGGIQAVKLVADSQYVINGLTDWMPRWKAAGWTRKVRGKSQPVLNLDLWKRLDELISGIELTCEWVRGHTGHAQNERCDQLVQSTREALVSGDFAAE
ncbi:MAG: ribonuclease HI [Phycisphaerales bacterium]|nr:ribonuclease HI [Phycisphaerales bacterium]